MIKHIFGTMVLVGFSTFGYTSESSEPEVSYAQDNKAADQEKWVWDISLGIAVFHENSPYLGADGRTQELPFLSIEWGPLFFEGDSLGMFLYGGENWKIAVSVGFDMFGDTNRGNSLELKDMAELDDVYNASIMTFYEAGWGALDLQLSTDISNKHDGTTASLSYSYPLSYKSWELSPYLSAQWVSSEVTEYYVGVSEVDAKKGRPAYASTSGTNFGLGINGVYSINDKHSLFADLKGTLYSDELKDSPIIDTDDAVLSVIVGYLYHF